MLLTDAIHRSKLALLLVSSSFLASEFIIGTELPALIENGVHLVPVLIGDCLWDLEPLLEPLQWAHDPKLDRPPSQKREREAWIVRICRRLLELLPATDASDAEASGIGSREPAQVHARTEPLVAGTRLGQLHGVPALPQTFVERAELADLRETILGASVGAVGVTGRTVGFQGGGGIGKTVLATALARDENVRRCFPDGVFWTTIGQHGNLVEAQRELLSRLGVDHHDLRSSSDGIDVLRQALSDRGCLVVVDDVWSTAAAAAFQAAGPRGRVLYTTRDPRVLDEVGAQVERIDVLSDKTARKLLRTVSGAQISSEAMAEILRVTGRVALAVALVGAAIRRGRRTSQQVIAELRRGGETFLDHPYADIFKAMQVAIGGLNESARRAYQALAVYPEDMVIPFRTRDASEVRVRPFVLTSRAGLPVLNF